MIPSITSQPIAQTVKAGNSASFSVVATGGSLSYQWQKGGVNIAGAIAATYSIASATPVDAGAYQVTVTNIEGSTKSNSVQLAVLFVPIIVTQPLSQTVTANHQVTFQVVINANPAPTFQWRKGGSPIANANSSIFKIASALTTDAGSYTVAVTNSQGTTISAAASLTVNFDLLSKPSDVFSNLADAAGLNPYHWDSVKLANLFPANWAKSVTDGIAKTNAKIDLKQGQLNKLVADTKNIVKQIGGLSADLSALQKDATDYLNNFFNTGAYYRIIGFDAAIANDGDLAREVRRVLNSSLYGKGAPQADPNFPNFVGDTAQLGGFVLLFGAPSFDKIKEQFKSLGKYFPGLGQGTLGIKQTFLNATKAVANQFKGVPAKQAAFLNQLNNWKNAQAGWNNLKNLWDGTHVQEVTDVDKWHSLSLAQLIPALDPLSAGSPASVAIGEIDAAFANIQSLFAYTDAAALAIDKLNSDLQKLQQLVDASQSFVTDVVNSVFNAGLYFHAYGSEYHIQTSNNFAEAVITSVNDTTDPKRPLFSGETSTVGGIIAIIGAPDASGFNDSFKKFKTTWTAIGLSAESWGKSFDDLKGKKTPEEQKQVGAVATVAGNQENVIAGVSLTDYQSRVLFSQPVPTGARVKGFLIQDKDIPAVNAGQKVQYTSVNNITVIVEASTKNIVTVTVLDGDIVTIKQTGNIFTATDKSQITTVIKDEVIKNYFAGEQLAREDGSILKLIGTTTTVFHANGSISQISKNGIVITTGVDGTIETTNLDGSRTIVFTTGVVKNYDKNGNLVEEKGPNSNKTDAEIKSGTTEYLSDGSIKYTAADGTITLKKIEADGSITIITTYTNGKEQTVMASGVKIITTPTERTTYFVNGEQKVEPTDSSDPTGKTFSGVVIWIETDGTKRQIDVDGTETITKSGTVTVIYPDGSTIVTRPDGTQKTTNTDGTVIETRKDGSRIIYFTDGKIQQIRADNTYIIIYPNGEVESGVLSGNTASIQPDGTITLQQSAGLQVDQLSDGSLQKSDTVTGQTIVVTPNKITTTQEDGTVTEVSDTERRTTDPSGNITVVRTTYELGSEVVDDTLPVAQQTTRQVIFRVDTYTVTKSTGEQSIAVERLPNRDIVRVIDAYGRNQVLEVPAVRTSGQITKIANGANSLIVQIADDKGNTTVLNTNLKSGEVTVNKVPTQKLSGTSIDFSSEFEQ